MGSEERACELCGAPLAGPTGKRGRPRDYCDPIETGRPCSMLARQIAHVETLADRVLANSYGIGAPAWRNRALRIGQQLQAVGGNIAYQEAPPEARNPRQAELWTETPPPSEPGGGE